MTSFRPWELGGAALSVAEILSGRRKNVKG
jgi:hypothetical protein